ncbi:MAG: hypothetical protein ABG776_16745 [Cyanobacteria bacterium J06555_13]
MTDHNEFQAFLKDASTQNGPMFIEVPPPLPAKIEKAPLGYDPMERIALEGRAYRSLASGQSPWWVMVMGWIIFGLPLVMVAVFALIAGDPIVLGAAVMPAIFLWIMWRGTHAKLALKREHRRAKYRKGMRP